MSSGARHRRPLWLFYVIFVNLKKLGSLPGCCRGSPGSAGGGKQNGAARARLQPARCLLVPCGAQRLPSPVRGGNGGLGAARCPQGGSGGGAEPEKRSQLWVRVVVGGVTSPAVRLSVCPALLAGGRERVGRVSVSVNVGLRAEGKESKCQRAPAS